jgi:hypothetical protein
LGRRDILCERGANRLVSVLLFGRRNSFGPTKTTNRRGRRARFFISTFRVIIIIIIIIISSIGYLQTSVRPLNTVGDKAQTRKLLTTKFHDSKIISFGCRNKNKEWVAWQKQGSRWAPKVCPIPPRHESNLRRTPLYVEYHQFLTEKRRIKFE